MSLATPNPCIGEWPQLPPCGPRTEGEAFYRAPGIILRTPSPSAQINDPPMTDWGARRGDVTSQACRVCACTPHVVVLACTTQSGTEHSPESGLGYAVPCSEEALRGPTSSRKSLSNNPARRTGTARCTPRRRDVMLANPAGKFEGFFRLFLAFAPVPFSPQPPGPGSEFQGRQVVAILLSRVAIPARRGPL